MQKVDLSGLLLKVQKPGRYSGGELNSVIKQADDNTIRFAFCFPDVYEVGMSHLGMKILYSLLNSKDNVWCERVFTPWVDMEDLMRKNNIPLFSIESKTPVKEFDFIGFTLQYELSYTNILNMLDLAEVPIYAKERTELKNIVICGGPCACNPEPLADFVDIFNLGEGEEVIIKIVELYEKIKNKGGTKEEFLYEASKIEGVYVPSFYNFEYNKDGTISKMTADEKAPKTIKKAIIKNLDEVFFPDSFVVPFIDIVHDRVMSEIFRGCIRGCRFCQAGFIYRPQREKSVDVINKQSCDLCRSTGYDEISLSSLSTSDYSKLPGLVENMTEWTEPQKVNLSLPSLRVDGFSAELLKKVKRGSLTFAPEAGTQRLRDVINKNVTEEELMNTVRTAFEGGNSSVKLYFMLGLPCETLDDVKGIAELAEKVVEEFYKTPNRSKGKPITVTISTACFVPKPFTPFQWEPQDTMDMLRKKQKHLLNSLTSKKVKFNWHESKTSFLEAVFAKGDRRLCDVLYAAYKSGCKFDGWDEFFNIDIWMKCFEECNIDPAFYANRKISFDEILPWSHLDYYLDKSFLIEECKKAYDAVTTKNCREKCSNCGVLKIKEGICVEKR